MMLAPKKASACEEKNVRKKVKEKMGYYLHTQRDSVFVKSDYVE